MTGRHTGRVRRAGLTVAAIASLGLVGAAAQASIAAHPGTGWSARGTASRARVAANWSLATRSRTGETAYVANYVSGTVTPITIATGKARHAIKVGASPSAIAITPDGKTAYVANSDSGTVTPVTIAIGKARPAIKVGGYPSAIAITPDGKTAYV